MRVFTARFLLGSLAIATVCVIASPAEAGPLRRLFGGRGAGAGAGAAACCPDVGYGQAGYGAGFGQVGFGQPGFGQVGFGQPGYSGAGYGSAMPQPYGSVGYGSAGYRLAGYSQPGFGYAASPCAPGAGMLYGGASYHQPGHLIPAGGIPMPLPGTGSSGTTDTTPANAEKAKITDDAFEPPTLTIKPGTAVRWTNDGQKPHTVTSVKGDWDSGDIPAGKDFTATFTKPGTFEYYCRHHKNMKGTIIVK